jgi:hypothetical protein
MRALSWIVVVISSMAYAELAAPIAPEELRHELYDQVVIADAKRDWATGAITVEHAPSEHDTRLVMTRAVDPGRIPATARAWQGRKLIAGRDGSTCASEVTGLHLLAVTEPASELGFWNGAIDPLPARGAVLSSWNGSHVWLVGELSDPCLGRTWVRAADLKPPAVAAPTVVSGPLRDRALAAFRALPAYRAVQARFRGAGEWDTGADGPDPVLRFDLSDRTLLAHVASAHIGRVDEQLLAVWELRDGAQPELKLRQIATTVALPRSPLGLSFAMDLRGDGRMLFAYTTRDSRGALYEMDDKLVDVPSLRLATR